MIDRLKNYLAEPAVTDRERGGFKKVLRFLLYALCVLTTFGSAAYALVYSIGAYLIIRRLSWQGESEFFYRIPYLEWKILPVVLSLTVCVIAWRFAKILWK